MNSKDLRGIEVVEKLAKIGVDSLKVEYRTKSLYYVARVAQSYRKAIHDAVVYRPFDYSLLSELEGLCQPRLHQRLPRTPPNSGLSKLPQR